MRTKLALLIGITGLAVAGWSAASWAHHAFAAEFDADKPVTFKGVITKMEWVNPHTWLHVDVKNPDGTTVNWAIEAGTPNVLFRRGFTKDSLLPGTEIVVDGYQSKDGSHRAHPGPARPGAGLRTRYATGDTARARRQPHRDRQQLPGAAISSPE
jgi:hypothetical protein